MTEEFNRNLMERAGNILKHSLFTSFEYNENDSMDDIIEEALRHLGVRFSDTEHHTSKHTISVLEGIIKIFEETDANKQEMAEVIKDDNTPLEKLTHLLDFYVDDGAFYINMMLRDVSLPNGDSGVRILLDNILKYDANRIMDLDQITKTVVSEVGAKYLPILNRLVEMVGIMKSYDTYVKWINVDDENEVKVAEIVSGDK